jgi:hypothetical protein
LKKKASKSGSPHASNDSKPGSRRRGGNSGQTCCCERADALQSQVKFSWLEAITVAPAGKLLVSSNQRQIKSHLPQVTANLYDAEEVNSAIISR